MKRSGLFALLPAAFMLLGCKSEPVIQPNPEFEPFLMVVDVVDVIATDTVYPMQEMLLVCQLPVYGGARGVWFAIDTLHDTARVYAVTKVWEDTTGNGALARLDTTVFSPYSNGEFVRVYGKYFSIMREDSTIKRTFLFLDKPVTFPSLTDSNANRLLDTIDFPYVLFYHKRHACPPCQDAKVRMNQLDSAYQDSVVRFISVPAESAYGFLSAMGVGMVPTFDLVVDSTTSIRYRGYYEIDSLELAIGDLL